MGRVSMHAFGAAAAMAVAAAWALQPVHAEIRSAAAVRIPAGSYVPLYAVGVTDRDRRVKVDAFQMDARPVTNAEFLAFVRLHPEWRRSRIARLFADETYLRHWQDDLVLGEGAPAASPVVHVSWFAARAYLASVGKRLPTQHEWEFAASSRPRGLEELPGSAQEWIEDFNAALVTGESRADAALDRALFCGGAIGASDVFNYPAFMRYAFRSSLDGRYGLANLRFRGVIGTAGRTITPSPAAKPMAEPSIYSLDIGVVNQRGQRSTLGELRGRPLIATMV
jgi:sulfatase modifying factor 1